MDEVNFEVIDGIKCYNPESAQNYKDYPSEGFALTDKLEQASFWCRSRTRLLNQILNRYTANLDRVKFLELGCGTGFFIRELVKQPKFDITGSDIYLAGLRYAKSKSPDIQYVQIDATSNYMQQKYDVIGAFDVIEHIEEDRNVIANINRSLQADGLFVVTVPQYQFLWSPIDDLVKHKRRYSKRELLEKLREGGFKIEFQSSFVFVLFPFMLLSRILDRKKPANLETSEKEIETRVSMPAWLNWMFDKLMRVDEFLIRAGVSLPFGGSLLVVARKQ